MRSVADCQLLAAAFCYLVQADAATLDPEGVAAQTWPWDEPFDSSLDQITSLRMGKTFIQAEIDRRIHDRGW